MRPALLSLALALAPLAAAAGDSTSDSALVDAQRAQVEAVRGEVAAQIQLQAYELLDELVYNWTQQPVFAVQTPLVLADVRVPVGFGSGLQALIENHFAALLAKNSKTGVVLAYCPQCTSMVVHSGAKGTIVSRGVDEPEALAAAGALANSRHALFLDFELEGSAMVLRTRITSLEPSLPIVYANTSTTSTSAAALLRSPEHLKSAAEARQEYLDVLQGRSTFSVPIHLGVRTYAAPGQGSPVMAAPFLWLEAGVEASLNQARAWTGSFSLGVSWAPQLHVAVLGQARIARLITGTVSSMTHPDLYLFLGGSIVYIQGQSAVVFQDSIPNLDNLAEAARGLDPHALFGTLQVGLELRVKNRLGVGVFFESLPGLDGSPTIGNYFQVALKFQALGVEVLFCF